MAEQATHNRWVGGSSPPGPTANQLNNSHPIGSDPILLSLLFILILIRFPPRPNAYPGAPTSASQAQARPPTPQPAQSLALLPPPHQSPQLQRLPPPTRTHPIRWKSPRTPNAPHSPSHE